MVKLRLRRKGRIHHPVYDIVAIDSRNKRDGAFIEQLGFYDPNTIPNTIKLDPDRAVYWLQVGAQPTVIVRNILSYEGILLRKHLIIKGKNQVEIENAVKEHKQVVAARYKRLKERRKARSLAKQKAKKEEEKKETEA